MFQVSLDARGDKDRVARRVFIGCGESEILQDGGHERFSGRDAVVAAVDGRARPRGGCLEVGGDELDLRVDADRGEYVPRDRIEERLRQFPIVVVGDEAGVDGLHAGPDHLVLDPIAQQVANGRLDEINDAAIESQPFGAVGLHSGPVLSFEADDGACRDSPELPLECGVGRLDGLRADVGQATIRQPRSHVAGGSDCCSAERLRPRVRTASRNRRMPPTASKRR